MKVRVAESLDLKLGYGWFYQPDNYERLKTNLARTKLGNEPEKSIHYFGNLTFTKKNLSLTLEAYFKDYLRLNRDLVFDIFERVEPFRFDLPFNTQNGTSKGLDVFVRGNYGRGNLFSLAYSFSRNRITDDLGVTIPRDLDRTHSVSINNVFKLAHDWTIGALWRYHTGDPFAPSTLHVFGDSTVFNSYVYFESAPKNSARHAAYHSLDIKIEKAWQIDQVRLTAYVNIVLLINSGLAVR